MTEAAAVEAAPNQFRLLGTRRFLPLFLVQFLGAFNDQVYKNAFVALLTFKLADQLDMPLDMLSVIASGLFILPFALLAPTAGQIADGVDKAVMIRWVKGIEIAVMSMAIIGFITQSVFFLYFVLFLMGAQSAIFAPIKYGVLPQYLDGRELVGGNGLVQAATFLAILGGTIAGNQLVKLDDGVLIVSIAVMTVAVIGFVAALMTPSAPPLGPAPKVDWVFPRAVWRLVGQCRKEKPAFRAILAIAWFWFVGATFLSLLPAYTKEVLGGNEDVLTLLLAGFSIGVALGALTCEKLCGGEVAVGLAPWGATGLALFSALLWWATPAPYAGETLMGIGAFWATAEGPWVMAAFIGLAAAAGLYVTPLNAVLQAEAPPAARGQFIACSNVVDAGMMVLSAVLVAVFLMIGLDAPLVLLLFGLTGLPMAVIIARYAPHTRLGRAALSVWPRGPGS